MITSRTLPKMVFLADDGSENTVDLSTSGDLINACAAYLRTKLTPGDVVGFVGRTGPDLVHYWLAALVAGLRPLILQYPTKKQSRAYWTTSVSNTVELVQMAALICDDAVIAACPETAPVICQSDLAQAARAGCGAAEKHFEIRDFSILQLSSGTTGHRKAMEFTDAALTRHIADYNQVLELDPTRDTIVSWLPLYHDMGYVACFVMPMMLGIPTVMMDPMTWIAKPGLLYDAITRHRGTISYMPNFGYELMAREPLPERCDLSSMRWWVTCSEPVSAATCRRFVAHIGAEESLIAPCYAMAENIFAMTIRRGLATREVQGVEAVSNGVPIPGVEVEIREGDQIWIRSPTSLSTYLGGATVADTSGFYPTGDLGALADEELYIAGRTQDLVIQAGRKYMLSDIDLIVNRLLPEVKGRGVAVQEYDARLGTQVVRVLIEDAGFFRRTDAEDIAAVLRAETSLDQLTVHFVPPRFLTKTSSGKFNRKVSHADWQLAQDSVAGGAANPVEEFRDTFKTADWDIPAGKALDSLSSTVLRILLADSGISYDPEKSLRDFEAALVKAQDSDSTAAQAEPEAIHIVSLADRGATAKITSAMLNEIGARLGRRVTFQHLCLPPSAITLSDLIFHRWFQPRVDGPDYAAITRAFDILSKASLILTDDVAEMYFTPHQVYAVLSHGLERDPRADLVAVRWQRYPQFHDRLPLTVVAGADLPLKYCTQSLEDLSHVLDVPIFRIATLEGFAKYTEGWEFRDFSNPAGTVGGGQAFALEALTEALGDRCVELGATLKPSVISQAMPVRSDDLAHFCSHYVNQAHLDKVLDAFDSFLIAGQSASVPYVRHKLDELGKPYEIIPSYAPAALAQAGKADAIVVCGPQGRFPTKLPTVAVMKADSSWENRHIEDPELRNGSCFLKPENFPNSGDDWFYPAPKLRFEEFEIFRGVRKAANGQVRKMAQLRLDAKEEARALLTEMRRTASRNRLGIND